MVQNRKITLAAQAPGVATPAVTTAGPSRRQAPALGTPFLNTGVATPEAVQSGRRDDESCAETLFFAQFGKNGFPTWTQYPFLPKMDIFVTRVDFLHF